MRSTPVTLDGTGITQASETRVSVRSRQARRLAAYTALFGLLLLAVLSGCGGGEYGRPGASLDLAVRADGSAHLDLFAAGRLRSDAEQRSLAGSVAREIFQNGRVTRVRTETSRGYPFARVEVAGAYRPGGRPSLRLDVNGAWRVLTARGFTEVAVRLTLPSVPATVRAWPPGDGAGVRFWRLKRSDEAPIVSVVLRPQPARWYATIALTVLCVVSALVGVVVRGRPIASAASSLAVVALFAAALATGRQGDNLGTAGLLSGRSLALANAAPVLTVPFGLAALIILVVTGIRFIDRRTATGPPRPGPPWPGPPPGRPYL